MPLGEGRCPLLLPQWMSSFPTAVDALPRTVSALSPLVGDEGVHGCIRGPNPPRVESKGRGDQLACTQHSTENRKVLGACRYPFSGRRHGRYCKEKEGARRGMQSSATQQ